MTDALATNCRDYVLIYLNGRRIEIRGEQVFMTLSDYLREQKQLTGTKVVCAEGDCGACTVLIGSVKPESSLDQVQYQAINACIQFMHGLDCCHVITVEGLQEHPDQLHPIQQAMVSAQGTQCGFCTPGFVMAAAGMLEVKEQVNQQQAKNYLTGNLCRCTGYLSIINAMLSIDKNDCQTIKSRYHDQQVHQDLLNHTQISVYSEYDNHNFSAATSTIAAAKSLTPDHQICAAATDLGVQYNKGHWQQQNLVSLNLIPELHHIEINQDHVRIGARVTLTQIEQQLNSIYPEWTEFLHIFASPQIKNNATLIGNIANGSPIGDNLPLLLAVDAQLLITGPKSQRTVNINDFYLAYRSLDLAGDEFISHVELPLLPNKSHLKLYKVSQRRDLDISCISTAFLMVFDQQDELQQVAIALGGVAATPIRLTNLEQDLLGTPKSILLDSTHCQNTANKISQLIAPLSDVRGSDSFRKQLAENLYKKYILELEQTSEVMS